MRHNMTVDPMVALKGWEITETLQHKVTIQGLSIFLNGISATSATHGDLVGSAASLAEQPSNVAWYELLERITILNALASSSERFTLRDPHSARAVGFLPHDILFPKTPDAEKLVFQFSKSNGVALDMEWDKACAKAAYELIERHLVLQTWLGESKPEILEQPASTPFSKLKPIYDILWVSFGSQLTDHSASPIHACGVFLFPKKPEHPLAFGFGAGISRKDALVKAERESVQRLGFLWGEEIPQAVPAMSPSPLFHQEYFLCPATHEVLRDWLRGDFVKTAALPPSLIHLKFADIGCSDLSHFQVARAYSPEAIPLVFGHWPGPGFRRLEKKRRIHPIA